MIIQAFYNGVTQPIRSTIDAAVGGTLMTKTEDEAYNLIKEMTLNNFQWPTEQGQPKRVGGKFKVDALTLLSAKVDAIAQLRPIKHVTLNCQVESPFPKTLLKSIMSKTSTRDRLMTLTEVPTIRVRGITEFLM